MDFRVASVTVPIDKRRNPRPPRSLLCVCEDMQERVLDESDSFDISAILIFRSRPVLHPAAVLLTND